MSSRFNPPFGDVLSTSFKLWVANMLLALLFGSISVAAFVMASFAGLVLVAT